MTKANKNNDAIICIDVQFHILENSSGDQAVTSTSATDAIQRLNTAFNPDNIYFTSLGINVIVDDRYYDLRTDDNFSDFNDLVQIDRNSNAINIYFVNALQNFGGLGQVGNIANVVAANSDFSSTVVHEVGHNFGLIHTHDTANGIENIQRTGNGVNCDTAGDLFCDTPVDPDIGGDVDNICNYIGNAFRNGLPYDPDTKNFMSFSRRVFRDGFSPEQIDAMKFVKQNNSNFQNVQGSGCSLPEIQGSNVICNQSTESYSLRNAGRNVT